jgi:hypothetical protein
MGERVKLGALLAARSILRAAQYFARSAVAGETPQWKASRLS